MIRIIAKLFAVTVALTAFLHVAPLFAAPVDMCRVPALMATHVPLHCLARLSSAPVRRGAGRAVI